MKFPVFVLFLFLSVMHLHAQRLELDTFIYQLNEVPQFFVQQSATADTILVPYYPTVPQGTSNNAYILDGQNVIYADLSWTLSTSGGFFEVSPSVHVNTTGTLETTPCSFHVTQENSSKNYRYGSVILAYSDNSIPSKTYAVKQNFGYADVLSQNRFLTNSDSIILNFYADAQHVVSIYSNLNNQLQVFLEDANHNTIDWANIYKTNTATQSADYSLIVQRGNFTKHSRIAYLVIRNKFSESFLKRIKIVQITPIITIDPKNQLSLPVEEGIYRNITVESNSYWDFSTDGLWLRMVGGAINLNGSISVYTLSNNTTATEQPRYANLIITARDKSFSDTIRNYFRQEHKPYYLHALPQTIILNQEKGSSDVVNINTNLSSWSLTKDSGFDYSFLEEPIIKLSLDSSKGTIFFKTTESNFGASFNKKARFKLSSPYLDITPIYIDVFQSNAMNVVLNTLAINSLWIKLQAFAPGLYVNLFDENGSIVFHAPLLEQDNLLNIAALATGVYFVYVYNAENQILSTEKFIKP